MKIHHSGVLVVDFGSQVTKLIIRRLREEKVESFLIPQDNFSLEFILKNNFKGIILSGSPFSVNEEMTPTVDKKIFSLGIPILGICFGGQLIAKNFGCQVGAKHKSEYGSATIAKISKSILMDDFFGSEIEKQVWMSHSDTIISPSKLIESIAVSDGKVVVFKVKDKQIFGIQFHPEVSHTEDGFKIVRSFCREVCGIKGKFLYKDLIIDKIAQIKEIVGNREVICALSGGIDSAVTAILIHRAIGAKLHCVIIDNGFMRLGEIEQVVSIFRKNYNLSLESIDASKLFIKAIKGVSDPENKRRKIGNTFINIFDKVAKSNDSIEFLAQGTLYPDVIESLSKFHGPSVTIKSHHNVGGLPKKMKLKLVEPLKDMFKDEVRDLGLALGLPEEILNRHPFPGPGLAIRIPGEVDFNKLEILRAIDDIYIKRLKSQGLYNKIWQAFAVLLPIKSVGVVGDSRTYEYTCVLRAICSSDGMTASVYPFNHDQLTKISTEIVNKVEGVNRVLFDITSKPPATIEWE